MHLTKHHGLGNDFLVLLDADGSSPLDADLARALCDRRTGLGADGVMRAIPIPPDEARDGAVVVMELRNADGSPAEMSGNGIRCLAQALVRAGWVTGPTLPIRTAAGLRIVTRHDAAGPLTDTFSVAMGRARVDGEAPEWAERPIHRALRVDVGNPHLVLDLGTPGETHGGSSVDLVELGEQVNAKVPGGANVHLLTHGAADHIAVRTYERGVGPTQACGTGACASAVAARSWGLVGDAVIVDQPGGAAHVTIGRDGVVILRGPAAYVAAIDLPGGWPCR